jgi:HEAT repeat protein
VRTAATEIPQLATLVIFAVNAVLLTVLVSLKAWHRRRMARTVARGEEYTMLLSRHLAYEHCTDPITSEMAEDPAFLDALIDLRNAVSGDEIATMREIVRRHGVIERQVARLEAPFPLGRRLRAAVALAEIGDETSAPVLLRHLDDREPEIRIQCARGLGRIRWTPAIDAIVGRFGIEIPWVRARFSDTLVGFGSKATWPLLAYIRINHRYESRGPALALRTLAQIQDDQAVAPLLEILAEATDLEVEIATIETLGELGSPEATPALESRLGSPQWELRAKSAGALGGIGDPASIPLLVEALRDGNWWVRRSAAAAIARIPGGIDTLYEALDDEDHFAADAAGEALTDAGELVSARRRVEGGVSEDDERLLAHMGTESRG